MRLIHTLLITLPMAALLCQPAVAKTKPTPSKIGIHLLLSYSPGAKKIIQAKCPIIKLLDVTPDMMAALKDYKTLHPSGIVVMRIYSPIKYQLSEKPADCAKDFWEKALWPQLSTLTQVQKGMIDYLEGPNECDQIMCWETVYAARWFAKFWVTLATLMHEHGFKPCVGSIPVGNPPGDPQGVEMRMRAFLPALEIAKEFGGAWCYHSYSLKYSQDPGVEYWFALRYRLLHGIIAKYAPKLKDLPLLITEAGVDITGTGQYGFQKADSDKYAPWLTWLDSEVAKDDYVKGVTLFQIGNTTDWATFDVEPLADWLVEHTGK